MKRNVALIVALFALLLAAAPMVAAQDDKPSKEEIRKELAELKEKFKERFKTLEKLKAAGKVGETFEGEAGIVKDAYAREKIDPQDDESPTIREFVTEENKDRDRLYELLAIQLETTKEKVALRDGKRRFKKAEKKEYLKPKGRDWITKEELEKEEKEKKANA